MPLPQLGAHESISGGLPTCVDRGRAAGCEVLQIFTKSNHQWQGREYEPAEVDALSARSQRAGIPVVASHSSYLINMGSPDPQLRQKSVAALGDEVRRCEILRIPNLVFHPGSHVGSGELDGLNRIADGLNQVISRHPSESVTLCLECTAGQGTNLGYRFEHLSSIIAQIDRQERVGVCLDSCHLFAAGYRLADPHGYSDTMLQFEQTVGFGRLQLMHLNDSQGALGSRKDRHAHIGEGEIGLDGFRHLIQDPRLAKIPMVLETPKDEDLAEDAANLLLLRSLALT